MTTTAAGGWGRLARPTRRKTDSTRATSSTGEKGFGRKSSAPSRSPRTRSAVSPLPLMRITGSSPSSRIWESTIRPSSAPSEMSSTTRSVDARLTSAMALSASEATLTG